MKMCSRLVAGTIVGLSSLVPIHAQHVSIAVAENDSRDVFAFELQSAFPAPSGLSPEEDESPAWLPMRSHPSKSSNGLRGLAFPGPDHDQQSRRRLQEYHLPQHMTLLPSPDDWFPIGQKIEGGDAVMDATGFAVATNQDASVVAIGSRFPSTQPHHHGTQPHNGSGEVRVYKLQHGEWRQLGRGITGDYFENDETGCAISLSDDGQVLAVGARFNNGNGESSGHVRVFRFSVDHPHNQLTGEPTDDWVMVGQDIRGEHALDESGYAVSLSGDGTIVSIGAVFNDDGGFGAGHVRVYEYSQPSHSWIKLGNDLDGETSGDRFGSSTALSRDGLTVASGARFSSSPRSASSSPHNNHVVVDDDDDDDAGSVRIHRFDRSKRRWKQIGQTLVGPSKSQSGNSVSLSDDGSVVAIGVTNGQAGKSRQPHVAVYRYNSWSDQWIPFGSPIPGHLLEEESNDNDDNNNNVVLNVHVSLSGNGQRLAVGQSANRHDDARVYEYQPSSQQWIGVSSSFRMASHNDDDDESFRKGNRVALSNDGKSVIVGSWLPNENGRGVSGNVQLYRSL